MSFVINFKNRLMDGERAEYNIYSEVQLHTFGDFYRKTYQPL